MATTPVTGSKSNRSVISGALDRLDAVGVRVQVELVEHVGAYHPGDAIFRSGDRFNAIYAVREGAVKTRLVDLEGRELVLGFHLPGELIGLDAIDPETYPCDAVALGEVEVCRFSFPALATLATRAPSIQLESVVLLDPQGREALRLPRVDASLSPRSLLHLGFDQLHIESPVLDVRRAADGRLFVAGLELSQAQVPGKQDDGRAADWFFRQGEFVIRGELEEQLVKFRKEGKLLEAQRLAARTRFDMEMLLEVGHCPGIENYARWFSRRKPGEPPYTLIDFFPDDFLMVVDESHVTLPQVRGMYAGDHSRKQTLVEHGFRLPSAMDNRPLRFDEWEGRAKQVLFMSATPAPWGAHRVKTVPCFRKTSSPSARRSRAASGTQR